MSGVLQLLMGDNGGAAGWTPLSLASVIGFYTAAAGVTESGGNVSSWADQGPLNQAMAQATGGNKPTYSASGFNTSFPGISFASASPQFLSNTTYQFTPTTTFSIFCLMQYAATTADFAGIVSYVANGDATDFSALHSFIYESYSTAHADIFQFGNTGAAYGVPTAWSPRGTPVLFGGVFDGANCTTYGYGGSGSVGSPNVNTSTIGASGNGVMAFGTRPWNGNTPSFNGALAFVLMTGAAMSAGDVSDLKTWTNSNWGTSL
jgi:hypothetical protein